MKLRDLFFSNLGWKIGALLLSLALWFHIATEKVYEKQFPAKIEFSQLPSNLKVSQIEPPKEKVSMIGTGKQLLQLMLARQVIINIDLSLVTRPGAYDFEFTPSEISNIDVSAFRNVTFVSGNHVRFIIDSKS